MSSIAENPVNSDPASYGEASAWLSCFEALGNGEVSADHAIEQASQAIATTGLLPWAMPMALGLWMNKKYPRLLKFYSDQVLKGLWSYGLFSYLIGMAARVTGKHELACLAYEQALLIEPDRHDTLYNLANLIKEDQPGRSHIIGPCDKSQVCFSLA